MSIDPPRYCAPGALKREVLMLSPLPKRVLIESALITALYYVRSGDTDQARSIAMGQTVKATQLLKLACANAKKGDAP